MGRYCFRLIAVVLIVSIVFVPYGFSAPQKSGGYSVSARSAIFSDSTNVKRLYGKNPNRRVLPASTTKVMTALLVLEKMSLHDVVTVSSRSTHAQPSKLYLRPGDKYKVRDLLYAILLNSANDASVVLAEAVAGSEWKFVQMMNARARSLGARNTRFANSNGLPTKAVQHTSAYDMYLIFRAALKHDFFRRAVKIKYKTIYSLAGRKHQLKSHNKMLFKGWKHPIYGKTGYTRAAQACFVGYIQKGKNILIVAVFGCSRRWDDIYHIVERYGKVDL